MNSNQTITAAFTANPVVEAHAPRCTLRVKSSTVVLPAGAKREADHSRKHKRRGRAGTIALIAACDHAASVTLTGRLRELLRKHPEHGKRIRRIGLGPVKASVGAELPRTLTLELPRAAVSALRHKAKESVTLTLIATNANGTSSVTTHIARLRTA
jgi:hypothetical protein